ncbi:MAG: recJ [Candidatus Adlerbacteria bacterium]|nr:recJ [Candidatus Adlerbacteria bacterium]
MAYRVREKFHDDLLTDLMHARGVITPDDQSLFLDPDYLRDSHDPFLLPDMDKAVDRVLKAVKKNEKVCVWSDYDCDGVPGGVMLTDFLRTIGLTVRHYIPHRHKEGYGLNKQGLDQLAAEGTKLVITIDLGTTEIENIAYANTLGLDVIVTDHHVVAGEVPAALALLNPKRPDSAYPFDGLCGAGVAWKLVQAILSKKRFSLADGQEKWYLDLVGLSTMADMVPLVGENRMLARYGLVVMKRARRPGLAALLSLMRIRPSSITEDDIGFMIAPRINAASRMDAPDLAAQLLATKDELAARDLARQLQALNDERKILVATTVKEVNKRLEDGGAEHDVIVMGNPNWRPGILGLVANSLAEAHGKPVFLWGREGGDLCRGSCRAGGASSVVAIMQGAADVFDHFGGHHASGGFSVTQDRVHELGVRLNESFVAIAADLPPAPDTVVERVMAVSEISHAHRLLKQLAPFGVGNTKPLFMFSGVTVSRLKKFGKVADHLELGLDQNGASTVGIAFFSTPETFTKTPQVGEKADIVGSVETDWQGRPRLRIVDIV